MATRPTCDHLTAEGQRFCPSCGTSLGLDHLPTGTAPALAEIRSRLKL